MNTLTIVSKLSLNYTHILILGSLEQYYLVELDNLVFLFVFLLLQCKLQINEQKNCILFIRYLLSLSVFVHYCIIINLRNLDIF